LALLFIPTSIFSIIITWISNLLLVTLIGLNISLHGRN
jgi:hypothetical protein